jgi:ribosomal protein S21
MITNTEVVKKKNENNVSLLKRFTRKVQSAGTVSHLKKNRYESRAQSDYTKKKKRLTSLVKKAEIEEKIKLGKITPRGRGRR